MSALVTALATGLLLGLQHATDADHVVAVSTVVSRARRVRAAAHIGLLWGLGHSATVLVVGGTMVATGVVISDRAARTLELCVAVMLVVLGVAGVRRAFDARRSMASSRTMTSSRTTAHDLRAGRPSHVHAVSGHQETWDLPGGSLRPLVVGIVHGLAGSAAIALAVLATIQDRITALGYLATFSAGTILGMSIVTAMIATPIAAAARRVRPRWLLRASAAAGLVSIGLGLWMAYRIGVTDGLVLPVAHAAQPQPALSPP